MKRGLARLKAICQRVAIAKHEHAGLQVDSVLTDKLDVDLAEAARLLVEMFGAPQTEEYALSPRGAFLGCLAIAGALRILEALELPDGVMQELAEPTGTLWNTLECIYQWGFCEGRQAFQEATSDLER